MTLVSVVIPCFNAGAYLLEAVASARAQTWSSVEVVVVDDGSDDAETVEALARVEQEGSHLIRIAHAGPAAARNAGIEATRGAYIFTLDGDDRMDPTLIERAAGVMAQDDGVGIVYSQVQFFGDRTGPWELPPYRFPDILLGNMIPSAALFRRSDWAAVGGYNTNMVEGWEDYDFWLSLIERGRAVVQIPEPLLHYRRHGHSRSGGRSRETVVRCYAQLFRNHSRLFNEHIETIVGHILDLRLQVAAAGAQRDGATR